MVHINKTLTCAMSMINCRKRGCLAAWVFNLLARGLPNDFINKAPNFATGNIIFLLPYSLMQKSFQSAIQRITLDANSIEKHGQKSNICFQGAWVAFNFNAL